MTRVRLHLLAIPAVVAFVLGWYAAHMLFGVWMP